MRYLRNILLTVLIAGSAQAYQIMDLSAIPGTDMIQITWKVVSGDGISSFVVQKSTDGVNWSDIGVVSYAGDNEVYQFTDTDVLMKNVNDANSSFYYRLKIQLTNNTTDYSDPIAASPRYSGIYRTWGSLKAMFR